MGRRRGRWRSKNRPYRGITEDEEEEDVIHSKKNKSGDKNERGGENLLYD